MVGTMGEGIGVWGDALYCVTFSFTLRLPSRTHTVPLPTNLTLSKSESDSEPIPNHFSANGSSQLFFCYFHHFTSIFNHFLQLTHFNFLCFCLGCFTTYLLNSMAFSASTHKSAGLLPGFTQFVLTWHPFSLILCYLISFFG